MSTTIIEQIKREIENLGVTTEEEEVGRVIAVGDGIAEIEGLTNIQMSEMSGVELLQEIKDLNPLIQVYVITAHSNLEYVIQCMKGGAYDFFEKPLKLEDIISTLNEASRRVSRWNQLYKRHSLL